MKKTKTYGSFRSGLTLATLLCWILPIIIITFLASSLLNENYNRSLQNAADTDIQNALRQVEIRLANDIEDSKAVSYDGVVRQAYREYQRNPVQFTLYRTVTDYLGQKFSRNVNYRAAFISFREESLNILPYAAAAGVSRIELLREFENAVLPAVREQLADKDTGIYFLAQGDRLYLSRNLLDNNFDPYAILIVELEKPELFQSLYGHSQVRMNAITIDDVAVPLISVEEGGVDAMGVAELSYSAELDGHRIVCTGQVIGLNLWRSMPILKWILLALVVMVVPLLLFIVWLFHRNVNHPMEVLINANSRVQAGERGYQITQNPPNSEFYHLYSHFNEMSSELKAQFERLYEEQQALQQAKIKALQSQINPHFLNNTLEIINWEARLAEDERVCAMLDALSTMLDASIGRSGRAQVPLREELKYVDAYLYISQERIGDRMTVHREVDEDMLDCLIPLLTFQPLVENAVEHNISRYGGELYLRAYRKGQSCCYEVEHDGQISEEGWQKIHAALTETQMPVSSQPDRRSVGIRNVNIRLGLLYGKNYSFTIDEIRPGRVLTQIILPA